MSDLNKKIVDAYGNPIKLENKITKTIVECKNSTWIRLAKMKCSDDFGQALFRLSCYMNVDDKVIPLMSYQLAVSILASEEWGIKSSINVLSKTDTLAHDSTSSSILAAGSLTPGETTKYMTNINSDDAKVLFDIHKLFLKNGVIKEVLPTHIPTLKDNFDHFVQYSDSSNRYDRTLPYLLTPNQPTTSESYGIGFGYARVVIEDGECYLECLFQVPEIEAFSTFTIDVEDISSSGLQILDIVQAADDVLSLNNNIIEGMTINDKNNVIVVDFVQENLNNQLKTIASADRPETLPSIPAKYVGSAGDHTEYLAALFAGWGWVDVIPIDYDMWATVIVRKDREYNLEFTFDITEGSNSSNSKETTNILTSHLFTFNRAKYKRNRQTNMFEFFEWTGEPWAKEISDFSETKITPPNSEANSREIRPFLTVLNNYKPTATVAFCFDNKFNPLGIFNNIGNKEESYLKYCKLNSCKIKIRDNLKSENPLNYMNVYINGKLVNTTELTIAEKDNVLFELKEYPENCSEGKHKLTWDDLLKFKELRGMYGAGLFKLPENLIDKNSLYISESQMLENAENIDLDCKPKGYERYRNNVYIKRQKTVMVEEPVTVDGSDDSNDGTQPQTQLVEKVVDYFVQLSDAHLFWNKQTNKLGIHYTREYDKLPTGQNAVSKTFEELKETIVSNILESVFSVATILQILERDIEENNHETFDSCFSTIEIDNANYFPVIEYNLHSGSLTYAFQFNKTGVLDSFVNTYPEFIQFHLADVRRRSKVAGEVEL